MLTCRRSFADFSRIYNGYIVGCEDGKLLGANVGILVGDNVGDSLLREESSKVSKIMKLKNRIYYVRNHN